MEIIQLDSYQQTSAEGFSKRMVRNTPQGLVFVLNFEPGQVLPAHTHAESEVLLTVLRGEGTVDVDGKTAALPAGSAVHCEGKESLSVRNTGTTPLSLLVFLYPGNQRFASNIR